MARIQAGSFLAGCLAVAAVSMGSAQASIISLTPTLPVLNHPYHSAAGAGCFPTAGVCIGGGAFTLTSVVSSSFSGGNQFITTDATYTGNLRTDPGNAPDGTVTLTGTIEQEVLGRTSSHEIGHFSTEIVAMALSGPFIGHTLDLTLDAGHTSTGTSTITSIGEGGEHASAFHIDSFFDVFVDLHVEGTPLTATRGPIGASLDVPEPASLALLAGPLLALSAARRRRA